MTFMQAQEDSGLGQFLPPWRPVSPAPSEARTGLGEWDSGGGFHDSTCCLFSAEISYFPKPSPQQVLHE